MIIRSFPELQYTRMTPPPCVACVSITPASVFPVQIPEEVWKTAEDRALAKRDEWGNPGERRCAAVYRNTFGHYMEFTFILSEYVRVSNFEAPTSRDGGIFATKRATNNTTQTVHPCTQQEPGDQHCCNTRLGRLTQFNVEEIHKCGILCAVVGDITKSLS